MHILLYSRQIIWLRSWAVKKIYTYILRLSCIEVVEVLLWRALHSDPANSEWVHTFLRLNCYIRLNLSLDRCQLDVLHFTPSRASASNLFLSSHLFISRNIFLISSLFFYFSLHDVVWSIRGDFLLFIILIVFHICPVLLNFIRPTVTWILIHFLLCPSILPSPFLSIITFQGFPNTSFFLIHLRFGAKSRHKALRKPDCSCNDDPLPNIASWALQQTTRRKLWPEQHAKLHTNLPATQGTVSAERITWLSQRKWLRSVVLQNWEVQTYLALPSVKLRSL